MSKTHTGKAEHFIENVSGCGPFQIILFIVEVMAVFSTLSYSLVFMSFGNYNPGWRCLDGIGSLANSSNGNISSLEGDTNRTLVLASYTEGSCEAYRKCQDVEFNPESSTVVTEWGLICDKSWMSSLTISLQMLGMMVGSLIGGQLSDLFGRKLSLYTTIALCGSMQLVSVFTDSWVLITVVMFFIGACSINNYLMTVLYVSEFMTSEWRSVVVVLPFWYVGSLLQALVAMALKDWRRIQLVGFVLHLVCFLPVFYIPESLRWLEVKSKHKQFKAVTEKVAKVNRLKYSATLDDLNLNQGSIEGMQNKSLNHFEKDCVDHKKYTIKDIFHKGYVLVSICAGLLTLSFSIIFYALTFGVKSLYGDFYINLLIANILPFPMFMIAILGVKYLTRRRNMLMNMGIPAVCAFVSTGLYLSTSDVGKEFVSTTLLSIARGSVDAAWSCLYSQVTEMYPTVVRGVSLGYVSVTARVGGILAPFIIPSDKDALYIFTLMTGGLMLVCCLLSMGLIETKGKPLKEKFEDDDDE